ncbi:MAG: hypothetical protein OXR07_05380 [Nitrospira sp.]|nr:hypothetical protein [Nitrospira sp.]
MSGIEVPAVPHVHQSLIATPAVRVQHPVLAYPPADNDLQRGFLTVRHDLLAVPGMRRRNAAETGHAAIGTAFKSSANKRTM